MRSVAIIVISSFLFSCETKPYINHSITTEKEGNCSLNQGNYKITANINGERYEFEHCLKDGFNGEDYSISRKGDTLLLNLPEPKVNDNKTLYKIILDVNAYPKYNFIKIGDDILNVVTTGN